MTISLQSSKSDPASDARMVLLYMQGERPAKQAGMAGRVNELVGHLFRGVTNLLRSAADRIRHLHLARARTICEVMEQVTH
jgi:hypothetical protein